jgi:basic membrane lipoprotein Med (substrate-binding protein (PBP1-ABC) superfamily)
VQLTGFGKEVPDAVKKTVEQAKADMASGKLHPFKGPVKDQQGNVKIADGMIPKVEDLEAANYFVEGVIGSIPK